MDSTVTILDSMVSKPVKGCTLLTEDCRMEMSDCNWVRLDYTPETWGYRPVR